MANKRYYWLKLKDDFFSQPKMKKLRKIAGGDTFTIIYLKMQLLSIKNNGVLTFEGVENTLVEELALVLDEEVENVALTIKFLERHNLLECNNDNQFMMIETIENIGSEVESAKRVREFRKVKTLQCNNGVPECNENVTLDIDIEKDKYKEEIKNIEENTCHVTVTDEVTQCHAPRIRIKNKNKEKEEEINILQEKNTKKEALTASTEAVFIFNHWNILGIIKHNAITPELEKVINKAIALYGVKDITTAMDRYSLILKDDKYFFTTKWTLKEFLKRSNALPDFLDNGSKWINYTNSPQGKKALEKFISNQIYQRRKEQETTTRYIDPNEVF